ncbi:autotransporter-associated beta strand repeat-containing protein [Achromobacter sp.]|uniref:autotransporter-associated beta strand repeat-containing protein n=1 Tax=Achromobacter sp. TaxID=134375 RepID=UPI003C72422E
MNHTYRIVFNRSAGLWQVASEHARGQGKGGCRRGRSRRRLPVTAMLLAALGTAGAAQAGPTVTSTGDSTLGTYSGSGVTVAASLVVGISSVGTLTVADGGLVTMVSPYTVILADLASAHGTINVGAAPGAAPAGAGFLATSQLAFGAGTGTLNFNTNNTHEFNAALISGAGTHRLNHYAGTTRLLGDSSGFSGNTTVSGGNLWILNRLGTTEGRIDAGAVLGATAAVTVSGAGAAWENSGNVFVGGAGSGKLAVEAGGLVSNQFGTVNAPGGDMAEVTVSGAGARWLNSAALSVANGGWGTVSVQQGGYLSSTDGYIGSQAGSNGNVTVSGANWINMGFLRVGDISGRGTLAIGPGGLVSNTDSYIGSMNGTGNVVVSGVGASWNNIGALNLGFGLSFSFGTGSLTIADAGTVTAGPGGTGVVSLAKEGLFPGLGTTGMINIGGQTSQAAVAAGTLNASAIEFGKGNATLNFNHTDAGYRFLVPLKSTGNGIHQLNQIAGSTIMEGDSSGFRGATKVSGGKLTVTGKLGGSAEVTGGVLQYGAGATGAANSLSGNLKVSGAGSMLALRGGATLGVAGDVDLADATVLDIAAGAGSPSLQANKVKLGDGVVFKLSGISDRSQLDKVLIQSTNGIDGDFSGVSVGGFTGAVDYLTVHTRKSADGLQYRATYDLSWTANNNLGHGTFTLANPADRFDVGVALSDQAANAATGWDGNTLTKAGAGTLVLSGNNTYSGGTVIAGGTLQVANNANLGSGALTFSGGTLAVTDSFDTSRTVALAQHGRFDVADGAVLGLTGSVAGSSDLIKSGAGTLRLDKASNAYGNTWIQSGTLIGNAASISGDVSNGGKLVFEQSINGNFSGSIFGAGALVKQGAGTLVLSGDHAAFTGKTTVSAGTLAVQGVLGGSAEVTGGILQYGNGVAGAANRLSGDLKVSAAGSTLSVQGAATLSVAGDVGLADGTVLDVDTSANGPVLQAGSVTLGDGVAFRINGITGAGMAEKVLIDTRTGISGDFGSVSVGGYSGAVDYLAVNTRKSADQRQYLASYGLSWMANNDQAGGTFTLTGATDRFEAGAALTDQAPNAAKGWNGRSLTKAGAGTLVLSGNNHYTGGTEILGGTLQVARDENLGAASGGLAFNGGTLAATDSFDTARAVTLANSGTFDVEDGARLGVNGPISGGGGLVKTGAGTLALGSSNSYIGGTTIAGGTLQIESDASLGAPVNRLYITGGGLATASSFDLSRAVTLGGAAAAGFDVAIGTSLGLTGSVSGSGMLAKSGAGTLVLSGSNSYTGGTRIDGGRLQISNDSNLGAAVGGLALDGGTLATTDTLDMARAIALTRQGSFDVAAGTALGLTGKVSGDGDLLKAGAGTLRLDSGANAYGNTWIQAGTLVGHAGSVSGNVGINGTLVFEQAADASFGGAISGSGNLIKTGAGTLDLAGNHASYTGETTVSQGRLIVQGVLGGSAAVTGGTLQYGNGVAGAANRLNGDLKVAGGTLSVQGPAVLSVAGDTDLADRTALEIAAATGHPALQSDRVLLGDGVTFRLAGISDTSRLDQVLIDTRHGISGDFASVSVGGFTGAVDYMSVNTRKSADNMQYLATYGLSWSAGNNLAHGTFTLTNATDSFQVGAALTDQAGNAASGWDGRTLTKVGVGTLVLSGDNSYGGGTTISGGVLQVGRDANLGAATGGLSFNGGTLATTGTFDTARAITLGQAGGFDVAAGTALGLAGTVSGGGMLIKAGGGTLVLSGNNTYAGGTRIVGGSVRIAQDASLGAASGALMFDGGALATTGSFETSRAVLLAQSGSFDVAADTVLGLNGTVSGGGMFAKTGAGTLVLGGSNTHAGGTRVDGGTLQVARDANLGAAAGAVAFGDGTLATTASFDTTRLISLMQSGRIDVAAGTVLGLSGTVSGAGGFAKLGAGTLILSASNSHAGGTAIAGGVLQVAQDANLGAAAGALTFNGGTLATTGSFDIARTVALAQTGTFDVAASTTLGLTGMVSGSGNLIKTGAGTLRLDSSANAYGNTLIRDGILVGNAASILGNVENNGTLVFDQGANASFGGAISGNGSLVKSGAGTLGLTGDSSGFTGSTTVQGGRLALNGKLGGGLNIGAGSVLAGAGTVGSGAGSTVTVAAGATLAPGNSIGTLTVDGDLVIESGARYAVETNPRGAEADLIHVTGSATINGGSVAHIGIDGDYGLRSVYTLLAADGTLSGRFDTVTSDYAFLTPKLGYDYGAGRVSLELARNGTAMASAADTRNQRAAAGAIDSIGMAAGNGLYDAIAVLPDDKGLLRASFDQLSGEIHASAKTVLIEDSRYVRDAASERLRSAVGAVGASSVPVLASAGDGARLAAATAMGPASWIQGMGSWRHIDGDGNAAQVKSSTGGFLLGVDAPVSDVWRLGLMAGYSRTDFNVQDRSSSGDSDNYHLGAYGGGQWGALGLRGGLTYSWHDIATRRSVSMPGYSDRLKASYDGRTAQVFADLSYRIDTGVAALEPFANVAYVNLKTDGYAESGGAAALRANSQTTETTYTTLGSRITSGFELGGAQATAKGSLGWRYAFGDLKPVATQAFAAGNAFTVAGVPIAKNSAVLEAALDVQVSRKVSFDLSYQGQLASGAQDHGVRAGLSVRF